MVTPFACLFYYSIKTAQGQCPGAGRRSFDRKIEGFSIVKKHRRAKPCGVCLATMQKLVSGADSAVGASIAAGTAVQASVCIDHIGSIALGNSTHGASICTSAAADAGRTDLISHKSTSIKICTPIVTQEIQKASVIYREKFHFGKRKQINTPVHRLFSEKSKKVKDYLLTLWVSVLYYNQGQRKSK